MNVFDWHQIINVIKEFGWSKGILTIFFFLSHYWIFKQYKGRLEDRQGEIDRIAEENREYRERFLKLLDEEFKFNSKN